MSFLSTGSVYGTLLNFRRECDALRDCMSAPPNAPVLYIKPANTRTPHGVVDCRPGDVVICAIEGLGALESTIAAKVAPITEPKPA